MYRYALALTGSPARAEQLTIGAAVRLARHIDAVGAAPVSESRLALAVRREVLDSRPRRRLRTKRPEAGAHEGEPYPTTVLGVLDLLSVDERVAFVLRHHDGLLLPDVGAALGRSQAEAEVLLSRAREVVGPLAQRYDDGTPADPCARLLRAVPGPPEAFADRVWASVDRALVPDYAGEAPATVDADGGLAWVGSVDGTAVREEVVTAKEPRRTGMTLLAGGVVLAVVLGVAALTAPGRQSTDEPVVSGAAEASTVASTVPASAVTATTCPGRGGSAPAVPDLIVDPTAVTPHPPDSEVKVLGPGSSFVPVESLRTVSASVRSRGNVSRVVVRRSEPAGGSSAWLVEVQGLIRRGVTGEQDPLRAWAVDGGGVVMTLQVEGHPDALVLVGLRPGGGGTWLRLPEGARPLTARADGSVLVLVGDAGRTVGAYQVLALT